MKPSFPPSPVTLNTTNYLLHHHRSSLSHLPCQSPEDRLLSHQPKALRQQPTTSAALQPLQPHLAGSSLLLSLPYCSILPFLHITPTTPPAFHRSLRPYGRA